ncbi:carboxypeptidase regulatory-like domain-containing protein [Yeosuana sp. MJ-SS3]|uniref:Carboxypeptidase regulatory-like domain-containing protein n=1 Tax=Gilvirhabdus luticola TaxID=3079858 RepID=A0ABU3U7K0_9FLAO|nr:carboxypeptidase regulatory-like domain-containing protein [Yeosuana sp. MJ-SS3]MDU8886384.1 carboxypeptidase regulatory-like domain-containing protein [Yeosuana sp. MJ-SS3]
MKKITFFLFVMLFGVIGYSQVTTSNIKGLVQDENSEPLPGANVVAIHEPTGTKYGAATNIDGRYNLLNLRVGGPYTITISFIGYKEQTFDNVFLTLGKTENLDINMISDSQELEAVVIQGSGGTGTFGSDRTGAETNVGRRELTRLPSISRSASDFTRLEPTASNGSFAGRNDQYNNFSLDGAIFNNPFGLDAATPGGQTDAQPISLDAIEQIQVSTAPYDVTQSGFTGATVNAVTKSGTNEFHGTVYGFIRNEDMTGRKIKGDKLPKVKLDQKQYGLSIGGPIVKNKLFFFANFEKDERDDLGQNWLPSERGGVNASRVLESDLIAVQSALGALGYDTGTYEGFLHNSQSEKGIFKLDWNINDNNRLAVIYNFLNASKEKPAHPTAIGSRGPNFATLQFENSGYEINNKLQSVQVELNSTLSSTATNKFQFGYTHFDDFRNPFSTPAPSILIEQNGSNYIVAGHEPFSIHNKLDQKVLQFSNNLNFFKGDHTFTVGFSFEKFMFDNSFNLGVFGGTFGFPIGNDFRNFASVQEFLDNAQPGGLIDGLIQGAIDTNDALNAAGEGVPGGWALAETNVGQLAFYLQDEWNVNEKFKLTYGLRFDKPLFFDSSQKAQEVIDRACCYVPDIPYYNPNTGETVFLDNTEMPNNDWLISPRVGFNYDVKGDDTFQLRGGSGLFTGRFPFVWLGNQIANPEVFFYNVVDPDYKFPQVWRTNIGTDYKFDSGLILTGDVSYTKDINGAHVQNWGLQDPTGTLNAPGDNRPIYNDVDKGNNAYVFTNSDKGRIWNVAVKAQKTFNNGLYAMMAYSYLNAKDVNSIEAEITGDAFDFNPIAGNANDDVLAFSKYGDTHRFIGVASKRWDYGNDTWSTTISTFFEYAQGGRFNYTYAGNINNDSSFQNNDLIYIPTTSEVQQMMFSGPGQADAFEAYIQQDDYLSENRGKIAERYGAIAPWRGSWDIKFLQDYRIKISEDKVNTIQFSIDILNFGNLLSSDWGLVQQPNNVSPLAVNTSGSEPVFTFDPNQTKTFGYDSSLESRWQMQFGLRYIF